MNMEQLPTPEKSPFRNPEKIQVEQTTKQRIREIWETTIDPSIRHLVCETSREEFRREVQSGKFDEAQRDRLMLFRRYFKLYDTYKKDSPALDLDKDPKKSVPSSGDIDLASIWDTEEESKEEKPGETETEKMRATRLTKAIEKKLIGKQQELAGGIASLFMNNGFNFIERQVSAATKDKNKKVTRFIIFIDPQKIKDGEKPFDKSISENFRQACGRFDKDFKTFLKKYSDSQKDGFRRAVNQLLTNNSWNFAIREDAEVILKYLQNNDKLSGGEKKSYTMYMEPKSSILGHNLITIEIETEEISARPQPADTTPKYADKVIFSSAPVFTIDIEEENDLPETPPQQITAPEAKK